MVRVIQNNMATAVYPKMHTAGTRESGKILSRLNEKNQTLDEEYCAQSSFLQQKRDRSEDKGYGVIKEVRICSSLCYINRTLK